MGYDLGHVFFQAAIFGWIRFSNRQVAMVSRILPHQNPLVSVHFSRISGLKRNTILADSRNSSSPPAMILTGLVGQEKTNEVSIYNGQVQNAKILCNTSITSNWVFGSIVPSFLISRVLSIVRI